jgi:hypothetical protein
MAETQFIHYDRTVIGFHGTDRATADRLVRGDPFTSSTREIEWLGTGIYFWEHAPKQAWDWATKVREHAQPAVVGAVFRLGNCFDLLDPGNMTILRAYKEELVAGLIAAHEPVPENHRKHKKLDCAVFNHMLRISTEAKQPIESFRAVYVPANRYARVWKGSWINAETHVQVSVTNPKNILAVWRVKADGQYGVDP